jgi:hypothetical protein
VETLNIMKRKYLTEWDKRAKVRKYARKASWNAFFAFGLSFGFLPLVALEGPWLGFAVLASLSLYFAARSGFCLAISKLVR